MDGPADRRAVLWGAYKYPYNIPITTTIVSVHHRVSDEQKVVSDLWSSVCAFRFAPAVILTFLPPHTPQDLRK